MKFKEYLTEISISKFNKLDNDIKHKIINSVIDSVKFHIAKRKTNSMIAVEWSDKLKNNYKDAKKEILNVWQDFGMPVPEIDGLGSVKSDGKKFTNFINKFS